MDTQEQIDSYIAGQPEAKRGDLLSLHQRILQIMPGARLWFMDGRNDEGKIVSNPNIGYGAYDIEYADGTTKAFYQIGLSANTTGISIYVLGIKDRKYLPETYGKQIGKASVTGYCIKFKALKDIETDVLEAAIRDGLAARA